MKFNLKTFPKLYKNCMSVFHKDVERWKKGFEAEFREMLRKAEQASSDNVTLAYKILLIKEILGD